ncbi:hypothetical protein FIBSPDRAFT_940977 [Athelia psychrophila]|uniref:Uncharacterized protein n=1 Tax=Athelia psychrophila TaxID=1759441 RepID=A0A167UZF6_9AGAM|nr:hypothetical protein FIBSPDRAFT_940977 [Fibularhizoctonia sp. CBS 109695]
MAEEQPIGKSLPSLSHRSSIAWQSLDDPIAECPPGNEDSAVLVLSSRSYLPLRPQNLSSRDTENDDRNASLSVLMYIDLRLSLPLSPTSSVSWAFAGLRHTLRVEAPRHRWDHVIDSRSSGCVDDVGETLVFDGKEVEVGEGFNPDSGVVERYFETWREEDPAPKSPFIFLSNYSDPIQSTSFMAVLGSHAIAMSQISVGKPLIAIRMNRLDSIAGKGPWQMVYSTTQSENLREQLETLLKDLVEYVQGNKRGDSLRIPPGVGQVRHLPSVWTVFDCGFISVQ